MSATPPSVFDLFVSLITSEKFIAALLGIIGGTIATFIAPWTKWHFKEKELKRESRKEKIRLWREELNKYNSFSDFYKTSLYNELVEYIPTKERATLLNNGSIKIKINHSGAIPIDASTAETRISERFHKVISDKEKEWNII